MVDSKQREIELKWQKIWEEKGVFNADVDNKKEKFFATTPYPYANSVMHIGHGKAYTTTDIFNRYQRLLGKNVLYPMAYHISGTPVLAVADGISRGDEKQIKLTRDAISDYISDKKKQDELMETFHDPKNIANFFSSTMEGALKSIGVGIDWRRQFTTGEPIYNKFVEWQYSKLYEQGILVRGKYPILYSAFDENAVGEDDIKDGDVDKVQVQEMNYILFKVKGENEYFTATSLRPDALFGSTNLWISSKIALIKVKVDGKVWIVAKDALTKIKYQFDNVEFICDVSSKEYIGKNVIVPIVNREVVIADASFIDSRHGTGVVYSSPAGSPQDFMSLVQAKIEGRLPKTIEVINTVDTFDKTGKRVEYKGSCPAEDKLLKFGVKNSSDTEKLELAKLELYKEEHYSGKLNELCGEFNGIYIKNAKDKVKEKLEKIGLGGTFYETTRRAVTRTGETVIVANLEGQWFLNYTKDETKEKAYHLLENMTYKPDKLRETQVSYLKWVSMRPCARKRGIGTRLPYDKEWIIEPLSDSTIYQMLYLIIHTLRENKIKDVQLTFEFFDYVFLGKGNINEISIKTKINVDLVKKMRSDVEYWKSFDFRYTASAHMSNHLSFLIYHYALIFPQSYHPKNITVGGMLIKDGQKISKSKGNGIPLQRIGNIYGADLYRLYVALAANYDVEMDFRESEIFQLEKKFNRFKELLENSLERKIKNYDSFSVTNKWLISKFYSYVGNYFTMMETMRMREAFVGILYEFLNDVSYHERRTSLDETFDVIRFIARDYLILMTPAIPHICEEYYQKLKDTKEKFVSLVHFNTEYEKYIDKKSIDLENIAKNLVENISRIKETKKLEKINKITIVQATDERFKLFDSILELLEKTKDFKMIFAELSKTFPTDTKFIQKFVPKTLGGGLTAYLSKDEEYKLLERLKGFLEKEFLCDLEIKRICDKETNLSSVIPGEPLVLVE